MKTVPQLQLAIDALILATAASLKEAADTDNTKLYRAAQKMLMPLGEFGVTVDELPEEHQS